jgi:hypothetical protein
MKKLLIPIILCLASCSDYIKVDDNLYQHGAVPKIKQQPIIKKDSSFAFWVVYFPILIGVSYMTWHVFTPAKKR